jgi:hypothetical protein
MAVIAGSYLRNFAKSSLANFALAVCALCVSFNDQI